MNKIILLIILSCTQLVLANNLSIIVNYNIDKNGNVAVVVTNNSANDILIVDAQSTFEDYFIKKFDPFSKGKTWTYLRNKNSGFGKNYIIFRIIGDKIDERLLTGEVSLKIAEYERLNRTIGAWQVTTLKVNKTKNP